MSRAVQRLLCVLAAVCLPNVAAAQAQAAQGSGQEFIVGGAWMGPVSMGSSNADLKQSNGGTLTLFETENSLGSGLGLSAGFGFALTKSIWGEVLGGFSRATLRSEVSDDFEDADVEPIRSGFSRFTVEGAALFYFRARGANAWFARGGGGWGRELSEGKALAEDTFHGTGSIGWRHWWSQSGRSGLRASGGVELRSGGLTLGDGVRFGPMAAVHIFFGF